MIHFLEANNLLSFYSVQVQYKTVNSASVYDDTQEIMDRMNEMSGYLYLKRITDKSVKSLQGQNIEKSWNMSTYSKDDGQDCEICMWTK